MSKVKTKARFNLESLESRENPSPLGGLRFSFPSIQFASGQVYADANQNGAKDAGEGGVNGVTVFADWNNNGAKDAGEPSTRTASATVVQSVNGVTTAEQVAGRYFFNAGGRNAPATTPIRVELPAGATLTTPVPTTVAGRASNVFDIGLAGVEGTPNVPLAVPPSNVSIVTGPTGSSVSGSLFSSSTTGSSSSFVSAVAYVSPTGQSFADVQVSTSGNGYASGTAVALGNPPAFESATSFGGVYVG